MRAFCPEAVCSDAFEGFANDTFLIKNIDIFDPDDIKNEQKRSQMLKYSFHWTDFLNDHNDENLDVGVSMDYTVGYNKSFLMVTDQGTVEEQRTFRRVHSDPILIERRPVDVLLPIKSRTKMNRTLSLLIVYNLLVFYPRRNQCRLDSLACHFDTFIRRNDLGLHHKTAHDEEFSISKES